LSRPIPIHIPYVDIIAGPRLPPPVRSRAAAIASIPATVQSRIPGVLATLRGATDTIYSRVTSLFSEAESSQPPPPLSSPTHAAATANGVRHRRMASRGVPTAIATPTTLPTPSAPSYDGDDQSITLSESKLPIQTHLPLSASRPLPPASPSVTAAVAYASTTTSGVGGQQRGVIHGKGRLPIVHAQPLWASSPSSHAPTIAAAAIPTHHPSLSSLSSNVHDVVIEEVTDLDLSRR
jgi:hypothetical protein